MPLAPGTQLGPYEVVSPLGAGGMGEVYRARHAKLERDIAIKVLPAAVASDREALARFEREAKAIAALSHPNILSIFDFGHHDGIAYAAMELLDGETLRSRLDAGPLSEMQAVELALQVASGLSAAHAKGIVHRDLKPENLFLTKDGHLKILDFGLVKRIEVMSGSAGTSTPTESQHTVPGAVMGTLAYMSPEQVRGLPVDERTDLFSFGVVLYEMVARQRPFRGNSAVDVIDAILREPPRDLDGLRVSGKLKGLIRRLLEKEVGKRLASANEVSGELRAVAASLDPTRRRLSRGAWIAIAAATLVIAAAAGRYWHRASRVRWALETVPEIERLVAAEELQKAAVLAAAARVVLPKDPTIEKLWMQVTAEPSVDSVPPGAEVSIRNYGGAPDSWTRLGTTPLGKMRLPRPLPKDVYVWRISKPGFAPTEILDGANLKMTFHLPAEGSVPEEMTPVPGGPAWLGWPLNETPKVELDDYLIDRHEVTNEEYKKFVDAGGYQKRDLWKQPFVRDGRNVPWDEALSLFRDATGRPGPATWEVGSFPKGLEKHPVAGVSWYEAAAYAEFAGKSLPTIFHWYGAAEADYAMQINPGSNFPGVATQPVGRSGTLSGFGTTDMAGNVKEWCWNESAAGKRFILGGGFGDPSYMFQWTDAQSPWDRRPNYGFRCVKLSSPRSPAALARFEPPFRDYLKEKPASLEVFRAYRQLYGFDKGELAARVEESTPTPDGPREKVTLNAAYGGERVTVYLYLPKNAAPPFQAVILFPGGNSYFTRTFDPGFVELADFVPRSGRVLVFPVYRGMFERPDGLKTGGQPPAAWRDRMIMQAKDLGRTLDYLETRKDIDSSRLAYFGYSAGGAVAPVLLAVEPRFKAAILSSGGFWFRNPLPEVDWINFVTRVNTPVLMLNGRNDDYFPVGTSQIPLFRLLGTPDKDKKHVLYEAGHGDLPHKEEARESLDWLDKYLGPVKRR